MKRMTWREANGFFHDDEANELQRLCNRKVCLEIGSFYGKSTVCMAEVATEVHAVDTFSVDGDGQTQLTELNNTIYGTFKNTINGYENVHVHIGRSEKQVPLLLDNYFDVVFIDATHTYDAVKEDVALSYPKLKDNGIFIFHDYSTWRGVTEAVDDLFPSHSQSIISLVSAYKHDWRGTCPIN